MARDVFVFCEQRDGVIQSVSYELLGVAREIADKCGQKVCALVLGYNIKQEANELFAYGADEVAVADDKMLERYLTEQYTQALTQVIACYQPNILLFGATSIGRDIAPKMSCRLRTGLTADCTKLTADEEGNLFMTRPAFGGNLFATIICPDHRPQMSTVRPGVMKKRSPDKSRKGEVKVIPVKFDMSKVQVKILEEVKEEKSVDRIEDAKILVSVGRGMGKSEQIASAEKLATELKGAVSSSRALVDAGIMPQPRQVGQTGKTVRPLCYFALGISGAVQHLAGMEESEFIIAVNKDRSAPIFASAHLGIVGDAGAVTNCLIKELAAFKKEKYHQNDR